MINAQEFVEAARAGGYTWYAGVPCSFLTPFINYVIGDDSLTYLSSANEGDAVAAAAGARIEYSSVSARSGQREGAGRAGGAQTSGARQASGQCKGRGRVNLAVEGAGTTNTSSQQRRPPAQRPSTAEGTAALLHGMQTPRA